MSKRTWQETLFTALGDGPTLTAAASASMLPSGDKYTFGANELEVGKKYLFEASGRISLAVTTPGTVRFDLRAGGAVIWDSQAIALDAAGYTNVGWMLSVSFTCRARGTGTATLFMGQGLWTAPCIAGQVATPPKAAGVAVLPWNAAPTVSGTLAGTAGIDSTVSNAFDANFTQTVGTGSLTLHQASLISLN